MKVIAPGGAVLELGETETTPTVSIVNYSRLETDDFGVTTVVERGFSRRLQVRMALPSGSVDAVQRQLASLRATPARWIADEDQRWLTVDGFYKDFELELALPTLSYCSLTVEGLAETMVAADPGGDPAPEGDGSSLQLLQPIAITDAVVRSSTVPLDDAPAWSAAVTYGIGARVIYGLRIFESLIAANLGNDPTAAAAAWLNVSPINRWAMFDEALGTVTSADGAIEVVLRAGSRISGLALLEVVGATVRVRGGGFNVVRQVVPGQAVTVLDLNIAAGADITVTIAPIGGQAAVGTLLFGQVVQLGVTEAAPTAGITDFSRKEVDNFGEVTLVPRTWAKRMAVRTRVRSDAVDLVADRLAAVRARPSLWIGQEGVDSLTVYGIFRDFSIEVSAGVSTLSLQIQGLSAVARPAPLIPNGGEVAWPDVTDPTGTKPADNADVTGDNVARDTAAVAGRPAAEIRAAAEAALDAAEALALTVTAHDGRITAARTAADNALDGVAAANTRIDSITAGGDVGDLTARVQTLEAAETNQNSAIAGVRQIIEAGSNSNAALRASISDQSVALYDLDQSVTDRFTTLRSTYGGNLSQLSDRITTVSDAQGSIVQRTTTLESRVDNLSAGGGEDARVPAIIARLDGTEFARTTALNAEAGRVSDALTRIGSAEGRLNSTEFARSTATNALATRATNVEARAGSLESTVGIQQTAIADAANKLAAARLTLKTAAGPGTEAEIELASDQSGGGRIRFGGNSTFVGAVEVQSADARGSTRLTSANYEVRDPNGQVRVRLGLY